MREIRFRAWDNKEKAFVTEYNDGSNGMILFRGNDKPIATWKELTCACGGCGGCMDSYKDTDDIEVMQYTGLKDKNGDNEIYECDIIDSDGNVIGNQYETPAILEEKTNLLIQGFGTKDWFTTYTQAVERGCHDA